MQSLQTIAPLRDALAFSFYCSDSGASGFSSSRPSPRPRKGRQKDSWSERRSRVVRFVPTRSSVGGATAVPRFVFATYLGRFSGWRPISEFLWWRHLWRIRVEREARIEYQTMWLSVRRFFVSIYITSATLNILRNMVCL